MDPEEPADLSMPRLAPEVVAIADDLSSGGALGVAAPPTLTWNVTFGPGSEPQLYLAVV